LVPPMIYSADGGREFGWVEDNRLPTQRPAITAGTPCRGPYPTGDRGESWGTGPGFPSVVSRNFGNLIGITGV